MFKIVWQKKVTGACEDPILRGVSAEKTRSCVGLKLQFDPPFEKRKETMNVKIRTLKSILCYIELVKRINIASPSNKDTPVQHTAILRINCPLKISATSRVYEWRKHQASVHTYSWSQYIAIRFACQLQLPRVDRPTNHLPRVDIANKSFASRWYNKSFAPRC